MAEISFAPTDLEVASGLLFGSTDFLPPEPNTSLSPVAALQAVVLRALQRPPCVVTFSGGRDSSAVLAVAAAVAREEGLPLPVPLTLRFPQEAEAEEADWQTDVVRFLGLGDWEVLRFTDEIDWVGPYAREALMSHGLLWPPNTHFSLPAMKAARGGSLLTGGGGDQVLTPPAWNRVERVLARTSRPQMRDPLRIAIAYGPRPVRRRALARRLELRLPWLTEVGHLALNDALLSATAAEPVGWGASLVRSWAVSRARVVSQRSKGLLARDNDVLALYPLDDELFLRALAGFPGLRGLKSRTQLMRLLFDGMLPDSVIARRSKASFNRSFFGPASRALAASWDGTPLTSADLVRAEALRDTWTNEVVDARSSWLLQALWLQRHPTTTHGSRPAPG
jgi:asparagine synthase (glutamine-hydrolysing)